MPIDYSLGEALRLFLEHLKQAGVTQQALTVYARALHGRFLAELIVLAPAPAQGHTPVLHGCHTAPSQPLDRTITPPLAPIFPTEGAQI